MRPKPRGTPAPPRSTFFHLPKTITQSFRHASTSTNGESLEKIER